MLNYLKNLFSSKYASDKDSVIISCYFNPTKSEYRRKAFDIFYESIKHLNHEIVELVIGKGEAELSHLNVTQLRSDSLLWHKESMLNILIKNLDLKYKYVYWIDADVTFTNLNWMVDGAKQLQTNNIIQPFEYCVHLEKDEEDPTFDTQFYKSNPRLRHEKFWRSFCANYVTTDLSDNENYDLHGHVGFAWGARVDAIKQILLYDKALIGGADHIMAHACAGQIPHKCITKSFTDNIDEVNEWSERFYKVMQGKIGYVQGDLYHIWHGDIKNRQYLKRIQDFTPTTKHIHERDSNGLFIHQDDNYIIDYFNAREETVAPIESVVEFGGGQFGGAGADSSWDDNKNENFS